MRIKYTQPASEDIESILDYIQINSPQGAKSLSNRIRDLEKLLCEFPFSGSKTRIAWLRRLVIAPYPYLLFYEVKQDCVIIHAVRHSTRDTQSMPDNLSEN
jgi:toxin ParE1/3/4